MKRKGYKRKVNTWKSICFGTINFLFLRAPTGSQPVILRNLGLPPAPIPWFWRILLPPAPVLWSWRIFYSHRLQRLIMKNLGLPPALVPDPEESCALTGSHPLTLRNIGSVNSDNSTNSFLFLVTEVQHRWTIILHSLLEVERTSLWQQLYHGYRIGYYDDHILCITSSSLQSTIFREESKEAAETTIIFNKITLAWREIMQRICPVS